MKLQKSDSVAQKTAINQIIRQKNGDSLPNDSLNKYKPTANNGFEIDEEYEAPTANRNGPQGNKNDGFSKAGRRCHRCRRLGHYAKECRMPIEIIERDKKRYEEEKRTKQNDNSSNHTINVVRIDKDGKKRVSVNSQMQFDAEIMGLKCQPMCDTGAQKTVGDVNIDREWQRLDPTLKITHQGRYTTTGPGGIKLKCYGKVKVAMTMGGALRDISILVIERCVEGILIGRDWLKKNKAHIDMEDDVMVINSVKVDLVHAS